MVVRGLCIDSFAFFLLSKCFFYSSVSPILIVTLVFYLLVILFVCHPFFVCHPPRMRGIFNFDDLDPPDKPGDDKSVCTDDKSVCSG